MSNLSLHMLGPFRATYGDEPWTNFRTKKVQALLVYLVTESEPQLREAMMQLLWPGLPLRSARGNLRQIVYLLRQVLQDFDGHNEDAGPLLVANRHVIGLNLEADVTADTIEFEALLTKSSTHDHLDIHLCDTCRQDLAAAVALYRGAFLADFYLEDSDDFDEWLETKQAYFRRRVLDALATLTTVAIRQQAYAEAERLADRQLQIDHLFENAYRQKMEALARNGRRQEALDVYRSCQQQLRQELAMAPTARTAELYERILAGEIAGAPRVSRGVRGYELKEQMDAGAYGAIHRAVQSVVGREVAVKVIRREYASDPDFIRRFEAEAQIIARLEHPHIVPLYDYWRDPDGAYLVMRYLRAGSLLQALSLGAWEPAPTVRLLDQISSALAAAHRQGVVHRDIKPGNILLDEAGNAYLSDFGIAKDLTRDVPLTADQTLVGTLDYISPEQLLNEAVTPQTDIYSLGAVLYETLTGEKPFGNVQMAHLIYNHLHEPIPLVSASRPGVPAAIDVVLQKATAKKPRDRFDDVLAMAAAFRDAVQGVSADAAARGLTIEPQVAEIYNPYKGLRAFQEADAADFFGRDALVSQLVARLDPTTADSVIPGAAGRFLAVVGPSGSGKSSVVKAGLIPALRDGALPGSDKWFFAEMVPGTHPLEELEMALWPVAVDPPPDLVAPMQRDSGGLLRTLRRILPADKETGSDGAQLLMVIDQFEELFTLVTDKARRTFFLESLLQAITAPRSPLRVIVTLRADFYDRPLQQQQLGELLRAHTEIVLPLNHTELTWAIQEPAHRMGVRLEEGLVGAIVADVGDQPGALPLLQYAMAELFDARQGDLITHASYGAAGEVQGALGQRAEALFLELTEADQTVARQLFLRLVTLGEGVEDTRRRVLRSELEAIDAGGQDGSVSQVIDTFGRARLLTFDRDPNTREPTVEVAHEALLRAWSRLRRWLDEGRGDVRLQRLLGGFMGEWQAAGRTDGFLLRDSRLDQFVGWMAQTTVGLSAAEEAYLQQSLAARQQRETAEAARRQRELEVAQQLATTEAARAEEQAQAATTLRQRAVYLGVALVVALVLAITAGFLGQSAQQEANIRATAEAQARANFELASTNEAVAVSNANEAASQEALAQQNANLAATREAEAIARQVEADNQRATAAAEAFIRATAESVAVQESEEAQRQAELATARELAASGLINLEEDPERSILLALESLNLTYTSQGEESLRRGMMASRLRLAIKGPGPIDGMIYDPLGEHLITTSEVSPTRYINVWDSTTGAEIVELQFEACTARCSYAETISADGQQLAVIGPDSSILILDWPASLAAGSVQIQHRLLGHGTGLLAEGITGLAFSPDGTRLASTGWDNTMKVWDPASGTLLYSLDIPARFALFGPSFSPDGRYLSTADINRIKDVGPKVYDAASGEALLELPTDVRAVRFHRDGRLLISLTHESITAWDLEASLDAGTPQELYTREIGRFIWYPTAQFSLDGRFLSFSGQDGNGLIWRVGDGSAEEELVLSSYLNFDLVAFSPDGVHLATQSEETVQIWDITPAGESEVLTFAAHQGTIGDLAQSQDGSRLATAGWEGVARTWLAETGEMLQEFVGHEARVHDIAYSPDDTRLVTASGDRTARVWNAATGEEMAVLDASDEGTIGGVHVGVMTVDFSPDGRLIATGAADGSVRLWDARSHEQLENIIIVPEMEGNPPRGITNVAFSPDGTLIAAVTDAGSTPGVVRVWQAATGDVLLEENQSRRIWGLAFSPDGTRIAIDGIDEPFQLWDLESEEQQLESLLTGPARSVFGFSPDGEMIVTSGPNDGSMIWDANSGEVLQNFEIPRAAIFTVDGSRLIINGGSGLIHILALDVTDLIGLAEARLTRQLTDAECQTYLHVETCPAE